MKIGNRDFDLNNPPYIMGILNVTPDSFSDGNKYNNIDSALFQTEKMIKEGADIVDIGGESTRPNHIKISILEEIERLSPFIEKIRKNFDVPLSLDSYKPEVVKEFIGKIDMVNDIWGLKYDSNMAPLVAKANLPYVLMHNRHNTNYTNFLDDVVQDIKESLQIAEENGIKKENIIIDAGIGFAKTYEQNLLLLKHLEVLNQFSCPQMIATSRKSVLGITLDNLPEERDLATAITTTIGITKGIKFLRVHNVKANMEAIKITNSILRGAKWSR